VGEGGLHARTLVATSLAVLGLFFLAYAWPLHFWGINFQTYLPIYVGIVAVGLPLVLAQVAVAAGGRLLALPKVPAWAWSLAVAGGMGLLFYHLVIETQLYGDTRVLLGALGPGGKQATQYHVWGALSPNIFTSKNGEMFTYSIVTGIQKISGGTIQGAFHSWATLLGCIYAFVWMQFTQRICKTLLLRLVVASLGLLAGIAQVFYGHPEVYAAPVLVYTCYLVALVHFLGVRSRAWLVVLAILLLLAIRVHSAGYALVPTFFYALIAHWAGDAAARQRWLGWRRAGFWLPLASIGIGALGYWLVFDAGADEVTAAGLEKNAFLTPVGENSVDNAYGMLSPWHVWDYMQEALLGSAGGCAIVLAAVGGWFLRKRLQPEAGQAGSNPAVVGVTMALVLLGALIFAIDPALTMPRDWDLCGLFVPPLLVLAALCLARHEPRLHKAWLPAGLLLAISALQATAVAVNHDSRAVHLRLIAVAQHTFISGHGGGGFFLRHAIEVPAIDPAERLQLLEAAVQALAPHETPYNRGEYGFICQYAGAQYFYAEDYAAAHRHFTAALERSPQDYMLHEDLAAVEYKLGKFQACLQHATQAIRLGSRRSSSWAAGFLSATILQQYPLALQIGDDYLQRFGDPEGIGPEIERVRAMGMPPTAE
jgi:hypothetical protein